MQKFGFGGCVFKQLFNCQIQRLFRSRILQSRFYLENVLQHPPDYELVLHIRTITSLMDGYPIAMPSIEYDLIKNWIKEYESEHNVSFYTGCQYMDWPWIGI